MFYIYATLFLFLLGAVFLSIEATIPGFGIFGAIGLVLVAVSNVLTVIHVDNGGIIVGVELLVTAVVIFLLFRYFKKKRYFNNLVLTETLASNDNSNVQLYLNKEGITKTPLKPVGSADFNGTVVEVFSENAFIPNDCRVKVIEVINQKIIVRKIN